MDRELKGFEVFTPPGAEAVALRQRVLTFIRDFIEREGYAPSMRDIMRGCAIGSSSHVYHILGRLEALGYLTRERNTARTIQLTTKSGDAMEVYRGPKRGYVPTREVQA